MKHYLLYAAGLIAAASVTSCVDDKYDLSDIDTTARIQVDNLTIPVNVDAITLSSLLDLDPNDPDAKVKEVNGIYAVVENGDFHSEMVHINQINANGVQATRNPTQSAQASQRASVPRLTLRFRSARRQSNSSSSLPLCLPKSAR